jgi:hypothetical protein
MRTVGQARHAPIPSPQEAWERGRALDAMLPELGNQRPRGVWRLSHKMANQMDDALALQTAQRLQQQMGKPDV